jgi:hypothetical protein
MSRIEQIRIGEDVSFFKNKIMYKYNLSEYKDIYKPVIFNGFYTNKDMELAQKHKSHLTIVWCGGDSLLFLPKKYNEIKRLKNFKLYGGSSVSDHGKYVYENYIDNIPNVDVSIWRLIFIFGTLFTTFPFIVAYIILWIILPEN